MQKVNGGIKVGTNLAGSLEYIKITSTGATYLNEIQTVTGNVEPDGTGALVTYPNSDLEKVIRIIQQKGTTVIISVESDTILHVAMENAGDGWDDSADTVDGSLAKLIKDNTDATAVTVLIGSFRVA